MKKRISTEPLKSISGQRWDVDNHNIVEYLRDLADVVDNEKSADEVEEKWDRS
ncbi:hypothetical protein GLW30_13495 [Halorubrum terrestre]|jgi:hypothetical protein|uniref:Uncharacterized protein n=1 Tax=Halorubrum distributum TaxID=29283 RepID=A0A6B1IQ44_9EURY|nr:hypothetical protein [Halorubrum terrestre]MYL68739.1 hypothetical protein [Halorubrum terrestre]